MIGLTVRCFTILAPNRHLNNLSSLCLSSLTLIPSLSLGSTSVTASPLPFGVTSTVTCKKQ